jgi:hypothetical protein
MAAKHALVTGAITGPIPTPSSKIVGDYVDVTPDILFFDDKATAVAVAEAIEVEQYNRGNHPLQHECSYLDSEADHPNGVDEDRRKAHQAAHQALTKRVG